MKRACEVAVSRLASQEGEDEFQLQYGPYGGCGGHGGGFHERLAKFLSSAYGSPCLADTLFTTNGVSHGVDLACATLSNPGDVLLMEEPSYFLVQKIFADHHLQVAGAVCDAHGLDTDALERRLTTGDLRPGGAIGPPKLLYLVPSHGNPSGVSLPLSRREHLVHLAERFGFFVLCDEVYHLLDWSPADAPLPPRLVTLDAAYRRHLERAAAAGTAVPSAAGDGEDSAYLAGPGGAAASADESPGGVLSIGSFTKILAPGLRLGWVEAAPHLIRRFEAVGYIVSGSSVAPFTSQIVGELLDDGGQREALDHLSRDYGTACHALCDALHAEGCFSFARPSGGYFVWVGLPAGVTATCLAPVAESDFGVAVLPGTRCAPLHPDACEGYIRLCFAYEEIDEILEGVRRLGRAVRAVQAGAGAGACAPGRDTGGAELPAAGGGGSSAKRARKGE